MARKRGRRRSSRRRFGGGGGGKFGGFFGRDTMAAVGGASLAAFAGPMIGKLIPASLGGSTAGRVASAVIIGGVGYMALKRWNRNAALAFAAASIAPTIVGLVGSKIAGVGVAGYEDDYYGVPDGQDYGLDDYPALEEGVSGDDDDIDDDIAGLGEYDEEAVEV